MQRSFLILFAFLSFTTALFAQDSLYHEDISAEFDNDLLYSCIKNSDWESTTWEMEWIFCELGFSLHDSLKWVPTHFTNLYNFYNENANSPAIVVAGFPVKDSIWEYWQSWSDHLTHGSWEPKVTFKTKRKALRMAQYNTLMLLSHELGHHLAHRYGRRSKNLNCSEYIADMASVALIMTFSENSKLYELQEDYVDLCQTINNYIPENQRFAPIDFDLHKNCGQMDVQYPKDTALMPQYASAYFMRRVYLHENKGYDWWSIYSELFAPEFAEWRKKYGRLYFCLETEGEYTNDFGFSSEANDRRSMAQWTEGRLANELEGYTFDYTNQAFRWELIQPVQSDSGGLSIVDIQDLTGKSVFRWYYVAEDKESCEYPTSCGAITHNTEEDVAFLIKGRLNDEEKLLLYHSDPGVRLNRTELRIKPGLGQYQLVSKRRSGWEVVHSYYVKDSGLIFEQIMFNDSGDVFNRRHLIAFPEFQTDYISWSATERFGSTVFLAINQYVLMIEGEIAKIIAGNGLQGGKYEQSRFNLVRAIHAHTGPSRLHPEALFYTVDEFVGNVNQKRTICVKRGDQCMIID